MFAELGHSFFCAVYDSVPVSGPFLISDVPSLEHVFWVGMVSGGVAVAMYCVAFRFLRFLLVRIRSFLSQYIKNKNLGGKSNE